MNKQVDNPINAFHSSASASPHFISVDLFCSPTISASADRQLGKVESISEAYQVLDGAKTKDDYHIVLWDGNR